LAQTSGYARWMRTGVARLTALCTLLAACASHGARPAQSSQPAAANAALASASPCLRASAAQSRWREMTWTEYYLDVESRAWSRGGIVIWVQPPHVSSVARNQLTCAR